MVYFFISLALVVLLHLTAMAVTAILFGIKITEFSFGFGPKLFRVKKLVIKALPVSGYVKLLDSREQEVEDSELQFAYDHKPWYVRAMLSLSGCVFLFLVALVFIGGDAFVILANGIQQAVFGLLFPMSDGQTYIEGAVAFIKENSFSMLFAFTALKMTALNLLPIPIFNGGQALVELLRMQEETVDTVNQVGANLFLLMLVSFVVAIGDYFWF